MLRLGVSRSYVALAAVLLVLLGVQVLNRQWVGDWYLHAASVRELAAHPFHPHHPTIGTVAADPEFSPYLLALGLLAKATGLSALAVLAIGGMLNVAFFVVAFWLLVRRFTTSPQAPTWALLFVLVLWGVNPWRWSGYPNLNSIGFVAPYPSMAAFVLVLFAVVALDEWCRRPRVWVAVVAGGLGSIAALVHPPTAIPAAIAAAAILVWRWRRDLTGHWWHLALSGALAALILAAWPLYPWFSLATQSGAYDVQNRRAYEGFLPRFFLLLVVGIPALFARWRRNRRDPLVLLFVAALAVFALGRVARRETLARTLPFAALAGQIAVADVIATRIESGDRRYRTFGVMVAVVGVAGCVSALPDFVPRALVPSSIREHHGRKPVTAGYAFLSVVPRDDVVAVNGRSRFAEPAFGGKELVPGFPAAFVDDSARRAHDNRELFSTTDAARRARILRDYHVRWLLVDRRFADNPSHVPLLSLGVVVHRDPRLVLVRLHPR